MKKLSHKGIALATILSIGTVNLAMPIHSFAASAETKQESMQQENSQELQYLVPPEMKSQLDKMRTFAQAMNMYSLMLIKNPDVNFEGIQLKGHEGLPYKIKYDQENARRNANHWENTLKKMLIDTNQNIINYDTRFQNYYQTLLDAVNKNDKSTLKEGISNLRVSIDRNRDQANKLREELKKFRETIGEDARAFGGDVQILSTILSSQTGGIPEDEARIKDLMDQIDYNNKLWNDGVIVASIPVTWWIGGIILATSATKLKQLEPLLQELKANVDYKKSVSRVAGIANESLQKMLGSIDEAINVLGEMAAHWDSMDAKYDGLLTSIDDASTSSLTFVIPELNAAKQQWSELRTYAEVLSEGIKELKIKEDTTK